MIKVLTPTLICCTLMLGNIAQADSELNRCLERNKASDNRFEICYGQIVDRKVSKRKTKFQESFNKAEAISAAEAAEEAKRIAAEQAKKAAAQKQMQTQQITQPKTTTRQTTPVNTQTPQRYAPAPQSYAPTQTPQRFTPAQEPDTVFEKAESKEQPKPAVKPKPKSFPIQYY